MGSPLDNRGPNRPRNWNETGNGAPISTEQLTTVFDNVMRIAGSQRSSTSGGAVDARPLRGTNETDESLSCALDEREEKIDVEQLKAFLQAFPSLDRAQESYPGLKILALSRLVDAEIFADFLPAAIGESGYRELTRAFEPEVIQRGLKELAARESEKKPLPAQRPEKIEIPDPDDDEEMEEKHAAPCRPSVLNYLADRETGFPRGGAGSSLARRFAAVDGNAFACMGIMSNHDVGNLAARYHEEIRDLAAEIKRTEPNAYRHIRGGLHREMGSPYGDGVQVLYFMDVSLSYCLTPLTVGNNVAQFFAKAFYLECTVRLMRALRGKFPDSAFDGNAEKRCDAIKEAIAMDVCREMMRSVLLTESAQPDFERRPAFERTLFSTLTKLLETGDLGRARRDLRAGAQAIWPGLPGRKVPASQSDPDHVHAARSHVERVRMAMPSGNVAYQPLEKEVRGEAKNLMYDIVYYNFISASLSGARDASSGSDPRAQKSDNIYDMGLALIDMIVCAGPKKRR